jgi:hypothetical protein
MTVLVDGAVQLSTNIPDIGNTEVVDEQYNTNFTVAVPAGKHLITITNKGNDWFYLDWVQLNQVLPATFIGNWQPSPNSTGLLGAHESLVYVVAPWASFPSAATNASLPEQVGAAITLTNWPPGLFHAAWFDPATATPLGQTQGITTNGGLTLPLPVFSSDLAGVVYPPATFSAPAAAPDGTFQFQFNSETGGQYTIEESSDLITWTPLLTVTNTQGSTVLTAAPAPAGAAEFIRARQNSE